jgi:hypothetical protein
MTLDRNGDGRHAAEGHFPARIDQREVYFDPFGHQQSAVCELSAEAPGDGDLGLLFERPLHRLDD